MPNVLLLNMEEICMSEPILVIGKNGQLGQSLQKIASQFPHFTFTFVDQDELDLLDPNQITRFFEAHPLPYSAIINCAAYTAVDKAESEPDLADRINHLAIGQLADIASEHNAFLVHVSTDYVFDGNSCTPYIETDPTHPQSVYGSSKCLGEQAMLSSGCKGAIIRTSWLYSEFGHNFVKTMLRLGQERDHLNVVFDQIGSPTYATDLAEAILTLLTQTRLTHSAASPTCCRTDSPPGDSDVELYHYSNEGVGSWYDFAKAIFSLSGIACQVSPIETRDYPTPAKRPHFSVMNTGKIKTRFSLSIPYWRDALQTCLTALGYPHDHTH
jgi:dTDP-4-dehydrorhamnose reductase